jgi:hypothetical protein
MSRLKQSIRTTTKRGSSIPATVVDINGNRASAQLAGRGAIYRNLEVIGGPAKVGDFCHVDMTTPEPTIVMTSKTWLTEEEMNRALRRLSSGMGRGTFDIDQIWVFSSSAGATGYPRTGAGFSDALSGSSPGSSILIPNGIITGVFVLPEGIEVSGMGRNVTSISGQVTGADQSSINNLAVEFRTTTSELTYAVIGPTSGNFLIDHCICQACNQGNSLTYGHWQPLGGHTDIDYSILRGECYGDLTKGFAAGIEESYP